MDKRIKLEKRGRPESQIKELNLDNCRSTNIDGLTDNFTALETLSLNNVGLVTLKNFPKLPKLKKLELSDNRISNSLNYLQTSPELTHINLSGNRVKELEEIKPLASLENLEVLDLFNNEVTLTDDYREKIFEMIPSLKYLDGFDSKDEEAPSEGEDDEANGNDEDEDEEEDEDYDEDNDDDEEDENDVSLAEVYNSDLEEDGSDWEGGEGAEGEADAGVDEDFEEEDDESNDEDKETGPSDGEGEEEESATTPTRGKKRKHDGGD